MSVEYAPQAQYYHDTPYPSTQYPLTPYPGQHVQRPQWDPERIWAEANGPAHTASASTRSGPSFDQTYSTQPNMNPGTADRGIGATLVGGGAGAFLGHELGHGKMATIGGLVAGVIAANALEHHEKKKKAEREGSREYGSGFESGERRERDIDGRRGVEYGRRSIDGNRQRGIDARSYKDEEEVEYERPHHHRRHHYDYDQEYDDEEIYDDRDRAYRRDVEDTRWRDEQYERRNSMSYCDDHRSRWNEVY